MAFVNSGVVKSVSKSYGASKALAFYEYDKQTITPATQNQSLWDFFVDGNYLYCAGHSEGVIIYDITDAGSPQYVTTIYSRETDGSNSFLACTDVIVVGTKLIMCARNINLNTPTLLTMYDVTTPTSPAWTGSYEGAAGVTYGNWYQGLDTDGTYVYCSAQEGGLVVFDISGAAPTVHGSLTTGDWETSKLVVHNGYCYMANHGFGVRIVDIANPALPGNVTDREIDMPNINNVDLRIRNVVAEGNYLYACNNTGGSTNHTERGLVVLDISDPTTIPTDGSTWVIESIAESDVDTWNGQGDKPLLQLTKYGNYAYLSNGQRGVAVFNVADPTNPMYLGLFGDIDAGTNLYTAYTFSKDGKIWCYYGAGISSPQLHSIYVSWVKNG